MTIIKTLGVSNREVGHLLWQLPPALLQVLQVRSQESIKKELESILSPTLSLEATVDQACSRNGELLCKRCYSRCLSCYCHSYVAVRCLIMQTVVLSQSTTIGRVKFKFLSPIFTGSSISSCVIEKITLKCSWCLFGYP